MELKYKKIIPAAILVLLFFYTCIYHKITHLDSTELEWVNNQYVGEEKSFTSGNGIIDTAIITEVKVENSYSPFNSNPNVSSEYIAMAYVDYKIMHNGDSIDGSFSIEKHDNSEPICFHANLGDLYAFNVKQRPSKLWINNVPYDDCLIFDERNSRVSPSYSNDNPIISLIWSKSKGLIQYKFKDGTLFSVKDR